MRQLVERCISTIIDTGLATLPYSVAMRLLAEATQSQSTRVAQPQDLVEDIDFYGQVERLTEQFVTDIRYVEMQKS